MVMVGLLLAMASFVVRPYLNRYSAADEAFAREYAGEMLGLLEEITAETGQVRPRSAELAQDRFLDGAEQFAARKYAAVHFKGELAVDFVYALAWAEEWCRCSARAIRDPRDSGAEHQAAEALRRARAELAAIQNREYRQYNR
jgi:hypothetical protein